jgi:hypothetical protein
MSDYQVQALRHNDRVTIIESDEIGKLWTKGENRADVLETKGGRRIKTSGVGIFIGGATNSDWLPSSIGRTGGKIHVNGDLETSMPGVFAIGDNRAGGIGRIGGAVGDGQTAERNVFQYFERLKAKARTKRGNALRTNKGKLSNKDFDKIIDDLFELDIANPYLSQTVEPQAAPHTLGGEGSGNFGHEGRPGEVGGSASAGADANAKPWQRYGGEWNRSPEGEIPYGWLPPTGDQYEPPELKHDVIRGNTEWGYSHGYSQAITGRSAAQMDIPGYRTDEHEAKTLDKIATKFLTAIAEDENGSEEILHHSFENVNGTVFKIGDTLRLPLTATSGDVGTYGKRLDAEDQRGEPVVFEFEKGTKMMAYSRISQNTAKDLGYTRDAAGVRKAMKEFGHVWDEAIVAGGFEVTGVTTRYMGSQHNSDPNGPVTQLYGKVVRLKQTETFDPKTGWKRRG